MRFVDGAGTTYLSAASFAGHKADQIENASNRDLLARGLEIDPRHNDFSHQPHVTNHNDRGEKPVLLR